MMLRVTDRKSRWWRGLLTAAMVAAHSGVAMGGDPHAPSAVFFDSDSYAIREFSGQVIVGVKRRNTSPSSDVGATVRALILGNGSAAAGVDYTIPPAFQLSIIWTHEPIYETMIEWDAQDFETKYITIPIVPDTENESPETIELQLADVNGSNAVLGEPWVATVYIVNSPVASLSTASLIVTEPLSGTPTLAGLNVTLTPAQTSTRSVSFTTTPGTATVDTDYTIASSPVTVPANEPSGEVPVTILRNNDYEYTPETVTVALQASNPAGPVSQGYILGIPPMFQNQVTINIIDDMTPQGVSIASPGSAF